MQNQPRSILVLDVSSFSRSLSLLPAVRTLRGAYPKSFIAAATTKGTCELLAAGGFVDDIIDLGIIRPSEGGAATTLKLVGKMMQQARRYQSDLVLDFTPRLETQMLSRLVVRARTITPSKIPNVIEMLLGRAGGGRGAGDGRAADYANVLKQIGLVIGETRLAIDLPADENAKFEQMLARQGFRGGEPLVVINASCAPRGWPVESFGELAARLAGSACARIVAVDEPSCSAFTDASSGLLPPAAIKLASPRSIELAAAIARASLVVTDEPALALLASEFGTPVLEISESALPSLSNNHRVVHGAWVGRITTDEVYEVACEMLQENRTASLFHR